MLLHLSEVPAFVRRSTGLRVSLRTVRRWVSRQRGSDALPSVILNHRRYVATESLQIYLRCLCCPSVLPDWPSATSMGATDKKAPAAISRGVARELLRTEYGFDG